jgi:hypothetical protein
MLRIFILSLFIFSASAMARPDFHMHKCIVFSSIAALGQGTATKDFANEINNCKQKQGSIKKVCADKKYGLCSKRSGLEEISPGQKKKLHHHLAAMLLGLLDDYSKKKVTRLRARSNNRNLDICLKQFDHHLISGLGDNFIKLLAHYQKRGKPLKISEQTKVFSLLDRIFKEAINEQKSCFENAKVEESFGGQILCFEITSLKDYAPSINSYCQEKKTRSLANPNSTKDLKYCNQRVGLFLFLEHFRLKRLKSKHFVKTLKSCLEFRDYNKACSILNKGFCKRKSQFKEFESKLEDKEIGPNAYDFISSKYFTSKYLPDSKNKYYRNPQKIEAEKKRLLTRNFHGEPDRCLRSVQELLDAHLDIIINEAILDSATEFGALASTSISSAVKNKVGKIFNNFNNKLTFIYEGILSFSEVCEKRSNKKVSYFAPKLCKRYKTYLKNNTDIKVKKLCRK